MLCICECVAMWDCLHVLVYVFEGVSLVCHPYGQVVLLTWCDCPCEIVCVIGGTHTRTHTHTHTHIHTLWDNRENSNVCVRRHPLKWLPWSVELWKVVDFVRHLCLNYAQFAPTRQNKCLWSMRLESWSIHKGRRGEWQLVGGANFGHWRWMEREMRPGWPLKRASPQHTGLSGEPKSWLGAGRTATGGWGTRLPNGWRPDVGIINLQRPSATTTQQKWSPSSAVIQLSKMEPA